MRVLNFPETEDKNYQHIDTANHRLYRFRLENSSGNIGRIL